jgi:hypothetical protein
MIEYLTKKWGMLLTNAHIIVPVLIILIILLIAVAISTGDIAAGIAAGVVTVSSLVILGLIFAGKVPYRMAGLAAEQFYMDNKKPPIPIL